MQSPEKAHKSIKETILTLSEQIQAICDTHNLDAAEAPNVLSDILTGVCQQLHTDYTNRERENQDKLGIQTETMRTLESTRARDAAFRDAYAPLPETLKARKNR